MGDASALAFVVILRCERSDLEMTSLVTCFGLAFGSHLSDEMKSVSRANR